MRKIKTLWSLLKPLFKSQTITFFVLLELFKRWQSGGGLGLKIALTDLRDGKGIYARQALWKSYQRRLDDELKPIVLKQLEAMSNKPLVSVLLPTYNTPANILNATIESIKKQWYPNWELCISDDASNNPATKKALTLAKKQDARIRVRFNASHKNISHVTNVALAMAKGDYVVFMDHDDLLQPQALFRVAQLGIEKSPDFIYSDEALMSKDGAEILDFTLRPCFSLEKLRNHPYIVHFISFKTDFIREIGGLNENLKISQDYDLILRTAEKTKNIIHIPEVLYLWRILKSSAGHQMQDLVMETSTKILQEHLLRCGECSYIQDSDFFNFFDVRYPIEIKLTVAIIVLAHNCADMVQRLIKSIQNTVMSIEYEIVIINYQSDGEESILYFDSIREIHTVIDYEGDFNVSKINNYAINQLSANYSHYLFCNNALEATHVGWLERMMELGQKDDIAIVGAKIVNASKDIIQQAGVNIGAFEEAEYSRRPINNKLPDGRINPGKMGNFICNHEVSAVSGSCLLIKSSAFNRVNGFDEKLTIGFSDIDLCLKIRQKNLRVLFCARATLIYHGAYTRMITNPHENDIRWLRKRWNKYIQGGDPYFNPNFSNLIDSWELKQELPIYKEINYRY